MMDDEISLNGEIYIKKIVQATNISVGQRFSRYGDEYMLAQLRDNNVFLVNLRNGNRFCESIKVAELSEITEDEFKQMTAGKEFKKLKEKY